MAINYLIGLTKAQLEIALKRAQEELLRGKSQIGSGAGDLNFQHRVEMEITERIKMILQRLSELDPVTYPPENTTPIDRTQFVAPTCL